MKQAAEAGVGIRVSPERLLPLWLTGGLFAVGLASFAAIPAVVWIARGPLAQGIFAQHGVVLLAHLYALGWGTAVALGAWQQLAPVALQVAFPVRLGFSRASFAAYGAGLALLAAGMARASFTPVAIGGGLIAAGVALAVLAVLGAMRKAQRRSVMTGFVAPALISLLLVTVVGVLLAINRITGWLSGSWLAVMGSHLYLGPAGWFGLLIPGVAYELAPFFGLTRTGSDPGRGRLAAVVALLLGLGIFGGLIASLAGYYHPASLALIGAGYLIFVFDLRGIYGRRAPERRSATLAGVRAAHGYLAGLAVWLAGAALAGGQGVREWVLFGWFAAAGWLSNSVAGYLHRILPFLLWHHRYWGKPKEEVKTRFLQMVSQRLGRVGIWVYNAGVLLTGAGLWRQLDALLVPGVIALAAGTGILVFNLGRAYFR